MKKQLAGITLILMAGSLLCSAQTIPGGKAFNIREEKDNERLIKQFDKDGDGKLSESEKTAAKAAMDERIKRLDTDGDGKLSEKERKAGREQMMKKLDTDGDGKISDEERKAAGRKKGTGSAAE